MAKNKTINIEGTKISILVQAKTDYISLTDMARGQMKDIIIIKWLSLKNTIEYLGEWEALYNPDFNYTEFGTIRNSAGSNNFVLSVKKWLVATNAMGISSKAGRYGGTYAHKDLAFHFGMWISPKFQLLLIKEYQRLKEDESKRLQLEWNLHRAISKINYKIHTDSIQKNIIPRLISKSQTKNTYASEADLLNIALFGITARQWKEKNTNTQGNIRDGASIEQLIVLSNMESINALLIDQGLPQKDRLVQLNKVAITQMKSILKISLFKQLESSK